jgi:hypothetical protein
VASNAVLFQERFHLLLERHSERLWSIVGCVSQPEARGPTNPYDAKQSESTDRLQSKPTIPRDHILLHAMSPLAGIARFGCPAKAMVTPACLRLLCLFIKKRSNGKTEWQEQGGGTAM